MESSNSNKSIIDEELEELRQFEEQQRQLEEKIRNKRKQLETKGALPSKSNVVSSESSNINKLSSESSNVNNSSFVESGLKGKEEEILTQKDVHISKRKADKQIRRLEKKRPKSSITDATNTRKFDRKFLKKTKDDLKIKKLKRNDFAVVPEKRILGQNKFMEPARKIQEIRLNKKHRPKIKITIDEKPS
jgi:hypothetical protein